MTLDDLPELLPVRQQLWSKRVVDLEGDVDAIVRRSALAGRIRPGSTVAIATGLDAGEQVIITGAANLQDGMRVQIGAPTAAPAEKESH